MTTFALHTEALGMTFEGPEPVEILKDVSFSVPFGQTVAITGRSGEGKTTLLHLLGGIESPTKGKLFIDGIHVSSSNQDEIRNQKIGYVFQAFHLLEDYTAIENVLMPAKIARADTAPRSTAYERAAALLAKVGLSERAHFPAKVLSGGEKQRVALARALMNNPKILLADEPTGNLDHHNAEKLEALLFQCAKEEGKAVLIVTHDARLASLCDRHYTLSSGTIS